MCYIVGWITSNDIFLIIANCVRCDNTNLLYSSALQEHIVCDDETTF